MAHHRVCHLCEAMCGITVETEGNRVTSIRGDELDPLSAGHICPKATALGDIHHDPDRLRRPLRKRGNDFEEIGWDEALDEVAGRLREIRDTHGRFAVAVYQGNPSIHNWGQSLFGQVLSKALRSRSMYSATSVDQLPKMLVALELYGHQLMMSVPDVDRTDLFVLFGANPAVSNGSLMSAPGMRHRIDAIKARGGRVVVFDPRRTETADLATEHHFVRPGTDAYVLFGVVHVLFEEGLVAPGRLAPLLDGVDALRQLAAPFAPERFAALTGVSADVVRNLARDLARTPRACLYGRVGTSMQAFGGLSTWLVEVIDLLTGHVDAEGGMMFTTPAMDLVQLFDMMGQRGHYAKWRTRVRGAPEFGGELPVACLAEEIETEGEGQVRALLTMAGNPVLSTPNGARLDRAIAKLDFVASMDFYVNETTRHAHVILPPTFALEHDHYDIALATFAVRNVAKYSPPLFDRGPDQRHDHEILLGLASRLVAQGKGGPGQPPPVLGRLGRLVGPRLTPARVGDLLLRIGPHGYRRRGLSGLTMAKVAAAPHGLDLGPLEPALPTRLFTQGKRIPLVPPTFAEDVPRLLADAARLERESRGLVLIGRRQLRTNNSWGHNSPRLVKGKDRCTVMMHPSDAASRGVAHGDPVRVRSRVGEVVAPAEVTDALMPGVVSLPHGFGHGRPGVRMRVASASPGVSINDLTDEQRIDSLTGVADFSGVPVELEKARADAAE